MIQILSLISFMKYLTDKYSFLTNNTIWGKNFRNYLKNINMLMKNYLTQTHTYVSFSIWCFRWQQRRLFLRPRQYDDKLLLLHFDIHELVAAKDLVLFTYTIFIMTANNYIKFTLLHNLPLNRYVYIFVLIFNCNHLSLCRFQIVAIVNLLVI